MAASTEVKGPVVPPIPLTRRLAYLATALAGPYPLALLVVAVMQIGGAHWPTVFGVDPPGDSAAGQYAGDAWLLGGVCIALAIPMFWSLLMAPEDRGGRWTTIVWLAGAIATVALVLGGDSSRACVLDDYGQTEVCTSRTVAATRDTLLFGLPAFLSIVLWVVVDRRERDGRTVGA